MRSPTDRRIAFIMILPTVIMLAIFVYGFIFQTIQTSMTDWGENLDVAALGADAERNFVGLDNYRALMTEPLEFEFRTAMVNTFFFTIIFVGGSVILGMILALLLDMNIAFEGLFRTIFLLPMSLSLVVTGTIWRWLFQPEGINSLPERLLGIAPYEFTWMNSRKQVLQFDWANVPDLLTYVGVFILAIFAFNYFVSRRWGAFSWAAGIAGVLIILLVAGVWDSTIWPPVGVEGADGNVIEIAETKGYQVALSGIIIAAVWQMAGYTMAMFLAGIRGIPEELREAARVDGCTEIGVYTRIVLPQLRPVALSAVIVLGHISLKIFDLVFAMAGRENFQTIVPGIQVYSAFTNNRFANASAIAVIMLVLVSMVIIPYLWSQLRAEE